MAELSKADLLRRDLKHASDRRERALELERFAEWIRSCERDESPLLAKVPAHRSWLGPQLSAKQIELTKMQSEELRDWLNAEVRHLRKYADNIEENLKI